VRQQFRLLLRFAWHVLRRFHDDKSLQVASSLTFTTLLSIVPLVTIALTLISAYPVFAGLVDQLQAFVSQHLLPEMSGKMISRYVEQFSARAGQLQAFGTVLLGITAFLLMFTIERAFNSIWRVTRPRPLMQRVLMYWGGLTLGPILIGASLSITSYLVSISLGLARQIPFAAEALLRTVPVVLTVLAFSLMYYIVPNRRMRRRDALAGGIAAGLLFELMKRGFALYVTKVPTYAMVYGAFASIPIFLLWIYLSWLVIVLGAIIAAAVPDFAQVRPAGRRPVGALFADALAVLRALMGAQREARILEVGEVAAQAKLPRDECEHLLDRMADAGWAVKASSDRWTLACDPERVMLAQVYRAFVFESDVLPGTGGPDAVLSRIVARHEMGLDSVLNLPLTCLLDDPDPAPGGKVSSPG
jgi:membrane protein